MEEYWRDVISDSYPVNIALSKYVVTKFQNLNIIFTINSFCRHRMLIDYNFVMKENNHHDLSSQLGLLNFFVVGESVCFYHNFCGFDKESKWCNRCSSPINIVFRKFRSFWCVRLYLQHWLIFTYICSLVRWKRSLLKQTLQTCKFLCRMWNISDFEMLVDATIFWHVIYRFSCKTYNVTFRCYILPYNVTMLTFQNSQHFPVRQTLMHFQQTSSFFQNHYSVYKS